MDRRATAALSDDDVAAVFDDGLAPVIVARFPPVMTLALYERLMGAWLALAQQHGRIALVVDYRAHDAASVDAALLAAEAAAFLRVRDKLARHVAAQARVVEAATTTKVLMAYQWMASSPWPLKNFTTVDDAVVWARAMID